MQKSDKYVVRHGKSVMANDGSRVFRAGTVVKHDQICHKKTGRLDPGLSEYVKPFADRPTETDLEDIERSRQADRDAQFEKDLKKVKVFEPEDVDAFDVDELRAAAETHLGGDSSTFQPDDADAVETVRMRLKGLTKPDTSADEDE
jgi:hypothetical protein